jgi:hypothetical protein
VIGAAVIASAIEAIEDSSKFIKQKQLCSPELF